MTAPLLALLACAALPTPVGDTSTDSASRDTGAARPWTVLSLNLHCFRLDGTSYTDNPSRFRAIAQAASEADAVLLQEACHDDRHGEADELLRAALEESSGVSWGGTWSLAHRAWEGTEDEADEGLAILTRGGAPEAPVTTTFLTQGALTRIALTATAPGGGPLLVDVHLDNADTTVRTGQGREAALAALLQAPEDLDVVVGGDLNDTDTGDAFAAFPAMGFDELSAGLGGIDHVFVHRGAPRALGQAALVFEGGDAVSDHPGVLVQIDPGPDQELLRTRVVAELDVGWGHNLQLAGDTAPLSWEAPWPAAVTGDARWEFVTTEWSQDAVEYKWVRDGVDWESGDNHSVTPGDDASSTPVFDTGR